MINLQTGIATAQHFLVDGICICCLYLLVLLPSIDDSRVVSVFVLYNVLAFLTQPLTGHITDRTRRRHSLLLASVALLALATLLLAVLLAVETAPMLTVYCVPALLGTGNSLFHVWGGKLVAETTANDIRAVGLFVSTGAMGLAVGGVFSSWVLLFVMLIAFAVLSAVQVSRSALVSVTQPTQHSAPPYRFDRWIEDRLARNIGLGLALLVVVGLMLVVMLRSMLGELFAKGVPDSSVWPVFLTVGCVSMLGKMAGGWLARGMGMVSLLALVVLVSAVCYCFRPANNMSAMLLGLFAVNCTMPVTLYIAQAVMRGREGLAFGLMAAALIPGYLMAL